MPHSTARSRRIFRILAASLLNVLALGSGFVAAQGAPIPPTPPFASPDIKPTFADWITAHPIALAKKIRLTDPLQKPPFAGAPADSLKGMAAGIRAVQLDIPNRIKAAQYLGTVDCVTYPQAQDMLIATMMEDPSEEVRYEAVMALRNMLTRGCCNMNTQCECDTCGNRKKIVRETESHAKKGKKALIKEAKGPAKKLAKKVSSQQEEERYDCCRGCANEKAMKALAKVASEKDDQCCWFEPSERVREAAADGMCLFKSYSDGYSMPEPGPEPLMPGEEREKDGEVEPSNDGESDPDMKQEGETLKSVPTTQKETPSAKPKAQTVHPQVVQKQVVPVQPVHVQPVQVQPLQVQAVQVQTVPVQIMPVAPDPIPVLAELPSPSVTPVAPQAPLVPGLRGRCIVALKSRQVLPADVRFSSIFEERTYYFSSAEAKVAFDQDPKNFAPAYGGLDPVSWLSQRQMQDGQYLREFNGQFFLFATKENWETFRGNPNRYVLRSEESKLRTVSVNE